MSSTEPLALVLVKSLRLYAAVLLAGMLVLAQQAGALHALSHWADGPDATQQQKHHPGEKVCDKCLVFAGIDSTASQGLPVVPLVDSQHHAHCCDTLPPARFGAAPYRSRAPPAHS
jgi:hypothetical protein